MTDPHRFGPLDSLLIADRIRAQVAELERMLILAPAATATRATATPDLRRSVYLPPKGSIALGLLYRSY